MDVVSGDPEDIAGDVDEQVDDERARQERLLWTASGRFDDNDDVVICHLPADLPVARRIAAELAAVGIRARIDDSDAPAPAPPAPALVERAHRAGAVILLLSSHTRGDWARLPIANLYAALSVRARSTRRRLRWLPVVVSGGAVPDGLPDFLRSFDWFNWIDEPRPARREALVALLGGVVVDRARS
jgi:hypothetical protein